MISRIPRINLFFAILIIVLNCVAFAPALQNNFIDLDDPDILLNNKLVRSLEPANIGAVFQTKIHRVYTPLTVLSFALEYHFAKLNPFIYHLDNLILHILTTLLIFAVLYERGLSRAVIFLTCLLFSLHPMKVESVAWITERKDVLYSVLYMCSILFYLYYIKKGRLRFLLWSLAMGLLSILAKPMALSLPVILCLLDWFFKRRLTTRLILEKICFFAYTIPIAWISFSANTQVMTPGTNIWESILFCVWSFSFYLKQFFFPNQLLMLYPISLPIHLTNPPYMISIIILVLAALIVLKIRSHRLMLFSFLFYLLSIGFLFRFYAHDSVFPMNVVADRFLYLPSLGLCLLTALFIQQVARRISKPGKTILALSIGILIGSFMIKTYTQNTLWKNPQVFWAYLESSLPPESKHLYVVYNNIGTHYLEKDNLATALVYFNKALKSNPGSIQALNNRADIHLKRKDSAAALEDFDAAIRIECRMPCQEDKSMIYVNRANFLKKLGRYEEALKDIHSALKLNPDNSSAYLVKGDVFRKQGFPAQAAASFSEAIRLNPFEGEYYYQRGISRLALKQDALAFDDFSKAITLKTPQADAYNKRAALLLKQKYFKEGMSDLERALTIDPLNKESLFNRGTAYLNKGVYTLAARDFSKALSISPDDAESFYRRAFCYKQLHKTSLALKDLCAAEKAGRALTQKDIDFLNSNNFSCAP